MDSKRETIILVDDNVTNLILFSTAINVVTVIMFDTAGQVEN